MAVKVLDPAEVVDERFLDRLTETGQPSWVPPMLATLTDDYFDDPDWIYERKLDGERRIAYRSGDAIHLMSRNENEIGDQYPEIIEALEAQPEREFIIDGEIVAFSGGVTSFSRLQDRMHVEAKDALESTGIRIFYYLFDLMSLNGFAYLQEACTRGWEGIITKDAASEYEHSRSTRWLKFKCVHQQELVVAGFTDPQGNRVGFLTELELSTCPFGYGEPDNGGVHFVTPVLVVEVGFTEWTDDGKLRHPRYLRLRRYKKASDVEREKPERVSR